MKYKPLFIYLFISSVFLTLVSSIWKIMATLQGLKLTEINLNINFLLALFLSLAFILIGKKFNHLIKIAKEAERILEYKLPGQVMHAGERLKKYSLEDVKTAKGN